MKPISIREPTQADRGEWEGLWAGYNAFYGRAGTTALAAAIVDATWARFLDPREPVHALVAEAGGRLVGLAHYLFHRSTIQIEPTAGSLWRISE